MSSQQLRAIAAREVENFRADRIDLMPEVLRVPAADYVDQARWEKEVRQIFRRMPLALGFTSEFREPGAFRTLEVAGVPVLMVRGDDGAIRSFVNMCSHRGNAVALEECGQTRRFRCGYHAWSFGLRGELVSVFDQENFGPIEKADYGLTPLPTAERAGIVWVTLDPTSQLDIDVFLSGYGDMLESLGFAETHVAGRQVLKGPNWKVAYDGYRDFYHVPILHRPTFGPDLPYQADFYYWGPHVRVTAPKNVQSLADTPVEDWRVEDLTPGVWTIFPNVSIAGGRRGNLQGSGTYMFSQMFPGATPFESVTIQNFLSFDAPDAVDPEALRNFMNFMIEVVEKEDYVTGARVQKGLATGARSHVLFGRNEGGGQHFHRWVDALIETPDAQLDHLFKEGVQERKDAPAAR